jgi:hemerythrin
MATWNESYKLDVTEIDNQHKKLFEIFDKLIDAMSQGKAKENAQTILAELDAYARTHFSNEEKYMQQFNYPDLNDHKEAHQFFYMKMNDFKASLNAGSLSIANDMMIFLKNGL